MSPSHRLSPVEPLIETYPTVAESVTTARRALARLASACGAAIEQIDAVRLAVSEAMTNAVLKGQGGEGEIQVRAALVEDALSVSIDDDCSGPVPIRLGLSPAVGLALIAHASDQLAISHRSSGGTELRMRFDFARVSPRR